MSPTFILHSCSPTSLSSSNSLEAISRIPNFLFSLLFPVFSASFWLTGLVVYANGCHGYNKHATVGRLY